MYVCMFAFGGHVFCPFATEIGTHTRHVQRKVCVKIKEITHRVPSRGIDPRVKFLDDANATHCSSFEHMPHQSRVDPMHRRPSQSFEQSNISCRRNLPFYRLRFSPNSDRICTESNLHVFCSKRYTGSVLISIETSAKSKIRIHSAYPGPRNKDCT